MLEFVIYLITIVIFCLSLMFISFMFLSDLIYVIVPECKFKIIITDILEDFSLISNDAICAVRNCRTLGEKPAIYYYIQSKIFLLNIGFWVIITTLLLL